MAAVPKFIVVGHHHEPNWNHPHFQMVPPGPTRRYFIKNIRALDAQCDTMEKYKNFIDRLLHRIDLLEKLNLRNRRRLHEERVRAALLGRGRRFARWRRGSGSGNLLMCICLANSVPFFNRLPLATFVVLFCLCNSTSNYEKKTSYQQIFSWLKKK